MDAYITLDYELFLGTNSGTPENCLVRPMNELCKIADECNFKFVIFVDATYLLRLYQLKDNYDQVLKDYVLVSNHIKQLAEKGHDIQLHIHPQWAYSEWNEQEKQWNLDRTHYKLTDMPFDESVKLIKDSKSLLESIIGNRVTAYRAGGFCMDSFELYREVFLDLGLCIDSSVARQQVVKSQIHSYDYRHIPSSIIYNFSKSNKTYCENGDFVELSISSISYKLPFFLKKIRSQRNKYKPKVVYGDGRGILDNVNPLINKLKKLFGTTIQLASIDNVSSYLIESYYEAALKNGDDSLVFIGHPKNASDVSIDNLRGFLIMHNHDIVCKTTGNLTRIKE